MKTRHIIMLVLALFAAFQIGRRYERNHPSSLQMYRYDSEKKGWEVYYNDEWRILKKWEPVSDSITISPN